MSGEVRGDAPSLRESLDKRAKPYRADWLFGVLNHVGTLWTYEVWPTAKDAERHIAKVQKAYPGADLSRHRVVPVKVTVSVSNRKDGSSQKDSTGDRP